MVLARGGWGSLSAWNVRELSFSLALEIRNRVSIAGEDLRLELARIGRA